MNIHEYQGKELLKKYNIPVLKGGVAFNVEESIKVAKSLDCDLYVVKAQVHAGGRGKVGGIRLAKNLNDVVGFTSDMLGSYLINKQTGKEGKLINSVYIESGCNNIIKEYYLSLLVDRTTSKVSVVASKEGGMDIEESTNPMYSIQIEPSLGVTIYQCKEFALKLDIPNPLQNDFYKLISNLYKLFLEKDVTMLEINPLVLTSSNEFYALDIKLEFDSNALFKHKDILDLRDLKEENEKEILASNYGLNYISLDGNIGCMVNGAGLAMATMDTIKYCGGNPANFLDVGGSASKENIKEALNIILSDKSVEGIFINIFGGIMKCDVIAEGVLDALYEINIDIPLVVRLEGTNVDIGKELIEKSNLNVVIADSISDGASKIVNLVNNKEII